MLGLASASGGKGTSSSRESSKALAGAAPARVPSEGAPPPPRFSYLPVGAPAARFRTRPDVDALSFGGARGSFAGGSVHASFPLDADGLRGSRAGASLVDWSAAGFDAFGETERPDATGTAGGNFFGKLAGQGLGFIRAL